MRHLKDTLKDIIKEANQRNDAEIGWQTFHKVVGCPIDNTLKIIKAPYVK